MSLSYTKALRPPKDTFHPLMTTLAVCVAIFESLPLIGTTNGAGASHTKRQEVRGYDLLPFPVVETVSGCSTLTSIYWITEVRLFPRE
jgi:hypothetical protein